MVSTNKHILFVLLLFCSLGHSLKPFWGSGGQGQGGGLSSFAALASVASGSGTGLTGALTQASMLGTAAATKGAMVASLGMSAAAKQVLKLGTEARKNVYGPFEKREKAYQFVLKAMNRSEKKFLMIVQEYAEIASSALGGGAQEQEEGDDSDDLSFSDLDWGDGDSGDTEEKTEEEEPAVEKKAPPKNIKQALRRFNGALKRFAIDRKAYRIYLASVSLGEQKKEGEVGQDYGRVAVPHDDSDAVALSSLEAALKVYSRREEAVASSSSKAIEIGARMCVMSDEIKENRDRIPTTLPAAQQLIAGSDAGTAMQMLAEWGKASMPKVLINELTPVLQKMYVDEVKFVRVARKIVHVGLCAGLFADLSSKYSSYFESAEKALKELLANQDGQGGSEEEVDLFSFEDEDEAGDDEDEEAVEEKRDFASDKKKLEQHASDTSGSEKKVLAFVGRRLKSKMSGEPKMKLVVVQEELIASQYNEAKNDVNSAFSALQEFAYSRVGNIVKKADTKKYEKLRMALLMKRLLLFHIVRSGIDITARKHKEKASEEKDAQPSGKVAADAQDDEQEVGLEEDVASGDDDQSDDVDSDDTELSADTIEPENVDLELGDGDESASSVDVKEDDDSSVDAIEPDDIDFSLLGED